MMHKPFYILILTLSALCAAICSCTKADASLGKELQHNDDKAAERWADSIMATLTIEERVAQLFVPRIDAFDNTEGRQMLKQAIQKGIGGFLLGKGTVQGYAALINYAQEQAKVPLLVTLDGEWGLNMRVTDAPQFPYNMTLGAITDTKLLYDYGQEVGRECRAVGINVDFAPVLDVNSNPQNPVIGYRSFGEIPERVAALGTAFSRGLESEYVLSVAKHFPGHGDTDSDSHKTLPKVGHSMTVLEETDLVPFESYINAGLGGIMVGHLNVPVLDSSGTPASLSKKITTKLLKEKLNFKGLVFTDALAMKGAVSGKKNVCIAAIEAGADVLLSPTNTAADIKAVTKAVTDGKIKRELIDKLCRKLLIYKYRLGLNAFHPADVKTVDKLVKSLQADAIINRLADAAITALRNENDLLPLRKLAEKKIVVAVAGEKTNCTFANFCSKYSQCEIIALEGTPTASQQKKLTEADAVVLAIINDGAAAQAAASWIGKIENAVAVFFVNPYKMAKFAASLKYYSTVVCAYQNLPCMQRAAAEAIFGGIDVSGRFPVNVKFVAQADEGVNIPKVRLGYSSPTAEGMRANIGEIIDSLINTSIRAGAMTGCQVAVAKDGQIVIEKGYGRIDTGNDAPKVTTETLFDLASMTKTNATLAGLIKTYDEGLFDLDAPIAEYIPQLDSTSKAQITPRQLLFHESGMPPVINIFNFAFGSSSNSEEENQDAPANFRTDIFSTKQSDDFPYQVARNIYISDEGVDLLIEKIHKAPLRSKDYEYSDLNFMLLKEIQENLTGVALDQWVDTEIYAPLGAWHTLFNPLEKFTPDKIAATEYDSRFRHQKIHGTVHDEMAACMGGVSGNAGLFSTAGDVAKLCQMWLNDGAYGGEQIIKPATARLFTATHSRSGMRGFGFDMLRRNRSMDSQRASTNAYGHTGFTGTCFWVDPDRNLIIVFLSNRINPTRNNQEWNRLNPRGQVIRAVYAAL